jgi:hypothetical protein
MARENYKNLMKDLTKIMGNGELDSNQLTQMCRAVFKKEFNSVCAWSEYIPNKNKPYSIVNTNNETGEHWLGAYTEDGKTVYVYDSFARNLKRIMRDWYDLSKQLGFKLVFVNKGKDQSDKSGNTPAQINCGLRSYVWIYCVKLYGINKARNI